MKYTVRSILFITAITAALLWVNLRPHELLAAGGAIPIGTEIIPGQAIHFDIGYGWPFQYCVVSVLGTESHVTINRVSIAINCAVALLISLLGVAIMRWILNYVPSMFQHRSIDGKQIHSDPNASDNKTMNRSGEARGFY